MAYFKEQGINPETLQKKEKNKIEADCLKKARIFVEDAKANKRDQMAQEIAQRITNCKTPADLHATV